MDYKKSSRFLILGLFIYLLLVAICVIIRPRGLYVNSGMSYYGNYPETIIPYSLVLIVNSALLWKAASVIGNKTKMDVYFRFVLRTTAVLMLAILLTPHHGDAHILSGLDFVHRTIATSLFSLQMLTGILVVIFFRRDWPTISLLAMATLSGYAALIYLLNPNGFMIEAQVVFQLSIWLIYIRYLNRANSMVKINSKVVDEA